MFLCVAAAFAAEPAPVAAPAPATATAAAEGPTQPPITDAQWRSMTELPASLETSPGRGVEGRALSVLQDKAVIQAKSGQTVVVARDKVIDLWVDPSELDAEIAAVNAEPPHVIDYAQASRDLHTGPLPFEDAATRLPTGEPPRVRGNPRVEGTAAMITGGCVAGAGGFLTAWSVSQHRSTSIPGGQEGETLAVSGSYNSVVPAELGAGILLMVGGGITVAFGEGQLRLADRLDGATTPAAGPPPFAPSP